MIKKLLLALILSSFIAKSQSEELSTPIHINIGGNFGNYLGVNVGVNYTLNNKHSFAFEFSGNIRHPKSEPKDYTPGIGEVFILSALFNKPYDHYTSYNFSYGKIYNLNTKNTIRANLSAGIGITFIKEPENWKPIQYAPNFEENYTYDITKTLALSLIINPKIEFLFFKHYGLNLTPFVQINAKRTFFGIGVHHLIGGLR